MKVVFVRVPAGTAANTDLTLPAGQKLVRLAAAALITVSDATSAGSVTELTPVETTPGAGEVYLSSPTTVQLGDAQPSAQDGLLLLIGIAPGEVAGYGDKVEL